MYKYAVEFDYSINQVRKKMVAGVYDTPEEAVIEGNKFIDGLKAKGVPLIGRFELDNRHTVYYYGGNPFTIMARIRVMDFDDPLKIAELLINAREQKG